MQGGTSGQSGSPLTSIRTVIYRAILIGQRQFVKNRCIFRCFLPIDVCDSATTVALARSRGLQPTVRLQTIRKAPIGATATPAKKIAVAPIGALGPNFILSVG